MEAAVLRGMRGLESDEVSGRHPLHGVANFGLELRRMGPPGPLPEGFVQDIRLGDPAEGKRRLVNIDQDPLGCQQADELIGLVDDGPEPPLARPERLLCPLALGDVVGQPLHPDDLPGCVAHRGLAHLQHPPGSILMEDLDLIGRLLDALDAERRPTVNLLIDGAVGQVFPKMGEKFLGRIPKHPGD